MRYGVKVLETSPAPEQLFSLDEAKLHLRVDYDYDDTLIQSLIGAATRQAEEYVGRSFVSKHYLLTLEGFPTNREAWAWPMQDGEVNPSRFGWTGQATRYPGAIFLPYAPLKRVVKVRYFDGFTDATSPPLEVWRDAGFKATTAMEPGYVVPWDRDRSRQHSWPHAQRHPEAVQIIYEAGYGAPSDVPDDYKAATKLILGHLYEHREDVTPGVDAPQPQKLPYGSRALLNLTKVRLP